MKNIKHTDIQGKKFHEKKKKKTKHTHATLAWAVEYADCTSAVG